MSHISSICALDVSSLRKERLKARCPRSRHNLREVAKLRPQIIHPTCMRIKSESDLIELYATLEEFFTAKTTSSDGSSLRERFQNAVRSFRQSVVFMRSSRTLKISSLSAVTKSLQKKTSMHLGSVKQKIYTPLHFRAV